MSRRPLLIPLLIAIALANTTVALAQDKGTVHPKPLPPLAHPDDPKIGAKELFGRKALPAAMPTRVLGFYAHGCIAGAQGLPLNGDTWQVMRLSRNRNWAHPDMVALLKRLAAKAHKEAGWPGILVGDMSQPRGGPMLTGHASHQVGLDADIWLTPMPNRRLSRNEREEMSAVMMVRGDRLDIDPKRVYAGPSRGPARRRAGARRAAHLRQRCDQEGAMPRGQGRSSLALARYGRCTDTTITSTSASNARRAIADARASATRRTARAASRAIWPTGSRIRSSTRSRRKCRRSRGRR